MKRLSLLAISILCLVARAAGASEQSKLLYSRGLVEFHAERLEKALQLFEQAVAADETDTYARYYRAVTRGRLNDVNGAISDLRAVVALQPDLEQAKLDLGVALIQANAYAEAVPWLEQAQHVPDLDARASLFLGLAHLRLGHFAIAREHFHRAAERDPQQSVAARYYQGVADYQEGRRSDAEQHFAYVTTASPDSVMGKEANAFLLKIREADRQRHQVYASVGFQYDSNVVLAPADAAIKSGVGISRQSDGRATMSLGGTYVPWQGKRAQLTVGYDFFQSLHFDLKEFNIQDHGPNIQWSGALGPVQFGLLGRYDYYLLDSDSFLQEATALPWVVISDGQSGRTELSYRMRRRDFKKPSFAVRDAFNHAASIRQYVYLNASGDRYVSLGYQFDREDPVISGKLAREHGNITEFESIARSFAYDGNEVNGGIGWTFPERVSAEATYAYRHERYAQESAGAIPSGTRRSDNEHQLIVAARKRLTDELSLVAAYLADFNNSNDSRFEYDRHIGSLAVEVRF